MDFNRYEPGANEALILIDIQNDFMPDGALAVPEGDQIIMPVMELATVFDNVILTQDWHPIRHSSFASAHAGKQPFETTEMPYGTQVLWPDHCVHGTLGAEMRLPPWIMDKAQMTIRKGFRREIDSYSAFMENDQKTATGLAGALRERGIDHVYLAGLALDFCVGFSALDARKAGFDVTVVEKATRGIAPESITERKAQMIEAGVRIL
jgi:nicotinamidase/pyrazinamidase